MTEALPNTAAGWNSMEYAIDITSEVVSRLNRVAAHYREQVEGKAGHGMGTLTQWFFTALMLLACEDKQHSDDHRRRMASALFSAAEGPQHAKLCRVNFKQQRHWHSSRGKPINRTSIMLHVTLASHMLEMWRLIEATLLRQGGTS